MLWVWSHCHCSLPPLPDGEQSYQDSHAERGRCKRSNHSGHEVPISTFLLYAMGQKGPGPRWAQQQSAMGRGSCCTGGAPNLWFWVGADWSSWQLHMGHWGWRGSSGAKGTEWGFWGLPENSTGCRGLATASFAAGLLLQKCHQRKEGTTWWPSGFVLGLGFPSPSKHLGSGPHSAWKGLPRAQEGHGARGASRSPDTLNVQGRDTGAPHPSTAHSSGHPKAAKGSSAMPLCVAPIPLWSGIGSSGCARNDAGPDWEMLRDGAGGTRTENARGREGPHGGCRGPSGDRTGRGRWEWRRPPPRAAVPGAAPTCRPPRPSPAPVPPAEAARIGPAWRGRGAPCSASPPPAACSAPCQVPR